MEFIIDSHVFIWFFSLPEKLSKKAKKILLNDESNIYLSAASIWEIGLKYKIGKLSLPENPREYILSRTNSAEIKLLPIQPSNSFTVNELELIHRDPFDRMIVAQSKDNKIAVLSNDEIFDKYNIERIW